MPFLLKFAVQIKNLAAQNKKISLPKKLIKLLPKSMKFAAARICSSLLN
jgi:hypothetical protein